MRPELEQFLAWAIMNAKNRGDHDWLQKWANVPPEPAAPEPLPQCSDLVFFKEVEYIPRDDTVGHKEPAMIQLDNHTYTLHTYSGLVAEDTMRRLVAILKQKI
jgi:hypothetical protein